jgi:hypothetical protein
MKKIYFFLLLSFFSSSAFADWQKYSSGIDEGTSLFFNMSTIKKSNGKVRIWLLIDYPTPLANSAKSIKYHREFDCKNDTVETLFITASKENMGIGDLIFSGKSGDGVTPIIPDSTDAILKNIICK